MLKNKHLLRVLSLALVVLMTIVMLASCSSGKQYEAAEEYAPYEDNAYDYAAAEGDGYYEYAPEEPAEATEQIAPDLSAPVTDKAIQRKIIKNGVMSLQADDVNATYKKMLNYVVSIGGYEFSYDYSEDQYDGSGYISAVFKLPPEKLDAVMKYCGDSAKILTSNTSSEDVTSEYHDYQTRLTTMQKSLDSYYALLEKAQTTESIIAIQSTINDLTVEIESIKGQLKLLENLTSEATLTISISQTPVSVTEDVEWDSISLKDMGRLSSNGFISVVNFLWSVIQWLFIILISISPLLVIAGIVVLIIVLCVKSNKKKKAKKAQTEKQTLPPTAPTVQAAPTAPQNDNQPVKK